MLVKMMYGKSLETLGNSAINNVYLNLVERCNLSVSLLLTKLFVSFFHADWPTVWLEEFASEWCHQRNQDTVSAHQVWIWRESDPCHHTAGSRGEEKLCILASFFKQAFGTVRALGATMCVCVCVCVVCVWEWVHMCVCVDVFINGFFETLYNSSLH